MRKLHFLALFVFLASCSSKQLAITQYGFEERKMSDSLALYDKHIDSIIKPYRDSVDAEMNIVLVINDTVLTKKMPESDLGNLLSEILLKKSAEYTKQKVDYAIINFGGIRIPQLPAGNVTLSKAFELMPFDNKIVLLNLDGPTTAKLFDHMAASGGVPIAGARYKIHKSTAIDITIDSKAFDINKNYVVALSDYLANGGENLDFLKNKTQIKTDSLLRNAFIDGFKEINAKGEHLKSIKDGRVSIER